MFCPKLLAERGDAGGAPTGCHLELGAGGKGFPGTGWSWEAEGGGGEPPFLKVRVPAWAGTVLG